MVDKIWYNMEELIGGSEERVLIETYWNVKLSTRQAVCQLPCINRNILECKGRYDLCILFFHLRINRNILECKDQYEINEVHWNLSINRNILECKVLMEVVQAIQPVSINRNILECKD